MEIGDAVFGFVFDMAIKDATKQKAFGIKGEEKKWLYDKNRMKSVIYILEEFVQKVIDGRCYTNQESYNQKFNELCEDICNKINSIKSDKDINCNSTFTFGNAQKLVNMTLKYTYIAHFDNDDNNNFRFCHCPMDGKMIKLVVNETANTSAENVVKLKGVYWSKIDFNKRGVESIDRYYDFQSVIKELAKELMPLEYDFIHWAE